METVKNEDTMLLIAYGLLIATFAIGATWIFSMLIAYSYKDIINNEKIKSHSVWIFNTCKYSFFALSLSLLLFVPIIFLKSESDFSAALLIVGFLGVAACAFFFLYRAVKGFIYFQRGMIIDK